MCGIIGILSRPSTRSIPASGELVGGLERALDARPDVAAVADRAFEVDRLLRGVPGVLALCGDRDLASALTARLDQLDAFVEELDRGLEEKGPDDEAFDAEAASLIRLRDALWALRRDRLPTARRVSTLAEGSLRPSTVAGYLAVQQSLSALDRLEVRGRDSAGVHLFVWGHDIDAGDRDLLAAVAERDDALFQSQSVRLVDGCLSFVYKAAAEIGELGDNTAALRAAIQGDDLLRRALQSEQAAVAILGHTRWASVGAISEPNAHPVNSDEVDAGTGGRTGSDTDDAPYVVAALNGDVDNHVDLRAEHALRFAVPITTDAKVIPALVARQMRTVDPATAFRRAVAGFHGSIAIGAATASSPNELMLALHGSGQGLYIGLAEDRYVVASEPYGLVEETADYVRLDGEHGGEVVVLDGTLAGSHDGIARSTFDGEVNPVTPDDVVTAEITTRDIDRGSSPHFLLKEITESPESLRKTLRGKIVDHDGQLHSRVGERTLPSAIADRLATGAIRRIRVIGQGTAAVAGQSMAALLDELTDGELDVDAVTATELSGFSLRLDMSDTLAVAVSQSGTTTDTNRTVDLLRARGAAVIAIVNRRGSDLTDKADGVLYTSDGRDVEMSVASTKAFYSQVAAGALLACAISEAAGTGSDERRHRLLSSLRDLPAAMRTVLSNRPRVAEAAQRFAPTKRYWAVVGNGPNKVAAEEVRIKLSELCYKSIACDVTEDKKHIDLSSEPLILVCAAGLSGGTAADVVKEVAIFRAHKAVPIVIVNEGEQRFDAAATITVPVVDPALGFVLSAMVGHLFGYEAALAIDESARPLHSAREIVERAAAEGSSGEAVLGRVSARIRPMVDQFFAGIRSGRFDGHLEASSAVRLASLMHTMLDDSPLETYSSVSGKVATPGNLLDDLMSSLTQAIEELTRPVDAIKHQAKTVTVGISRSDEGVLDRPLVQAALQAGAGRDVLTYRCIKVLADLDAAVAEVKGFTRYRVTGNSIEVVDRGGLARNLRSRVDANAALKGTKRSVANGRELVVARGRRDGRTVILVPETKGSECTGITLLHVRFHDRLPATTMRTVMAGYDRRYDRLVDFVTETEGEFDDCRLADVSVEDLLIEPIAGLADTWVSPSG
jgi:glucosamine--fructose-6-phosphate aminotransferase (isomerizing)